MTLHQQHHQHPVNLLLSFQLHTSQAKDGPLILIGTSSILGWNTPSRKMLHSAFLFSSPAINNSRPEKSFTEIGFRDWKHATGATGVFQKHANCITHKQPLVAWQQFLASEKNQSVAEQLGISRAEQIKKTAIILCPSLKCYYFIANRR